MWFLVICLGIVTLALFPTLYRKSIFPRGKIEKNRLICKYPPAFLWILLLFECFWTFIFVLALMQGLEEGIGIVEILLYSFGFFISFLFLVIIYICLRYKIVLDLDKQKVIIRRLYLPRKVVLFSEIYERDSKMKKEMEIVKDKNGKKLFYNVIFLTGDACLSNCLNIIINNNKKNEPIDEDKLKKMFDIEQSRSF